MCSIILDDDLIVDAKSSLANDGLAEPSEGIAEEVFLDEVA